MKRSAMVLLAAALLPATVSAQRTDAERDAEIERLRATVELLVGRMEALEAERAAAQAAKPPPEAAGAAEAATVVEAPGPAPTVADRTALHVPHPEQRDTIDDDETAAGRPDIELPAGSEGLEGFFPIRGTETWLRLGGYAKLDAMYDSDDTGNTDLFVASGIPAGSQAGHVSFNMHARQTRFNIDARRPTRAGWLRFVLENDFFGSGGTYGYRLRHAYGQIGNTYAGFGFSAFMDLGAGPDTLDFAGPGAVVSRRLASVRQYLPLRHGNQLVFAAEHARPEIWQGGGAVQERSSAPGLVVAARHTSEDWHVQLGALLRHLAYENGSTDDSAFGGGLALTGSWSGLGGGYLVYGATAGRGIAAYTSDLGGLGLDAAVDADGSLDALGQWGTWVGYTYPWSHEWRSTLTYGRLSLDRSPWLGPEAFRRSDYAAANLIWSPLPSWVWGVELLYGRVERQDGIDGDAFRLQASLKYDFIK